MTERARRLAADFDRSFAEPARAVETGGESVLAIRVGDGEYMLRLADVVTVRRAPRIVALPNASAIQLGIAGLRGNLVTVFSLAALLGVRGDDSGVESGWIAALSRHRGMAIAFAGMNGQRELGPRERPPTLLDVTALLERGGVAL